MPPKASKKTKAKLSAEEMSLRTRRPIRAFLGLQNRVTDLHEDTVIESAEQINENRVRSISFEKKLSVPKVGTARTSKPSPAPKGSGGPAVAEALKEISGILILLTEKERSAVLTKLCGAFSFQTKGTRSSGPKHTMEKTADNAHFSQTFPGSVLSHTTKVMRKCIKSPEEKPSHAVYLVHREALRGKAIHKANPKELPTGECPSDEFVQLIKGVEIISSSLEEGSDTPAASIVDAARCLYQGQSNALLSSLGLEQSVLVEGEAPLLTVPRTEEEAEKRIAIISSKKSKGKSSKRNASGRDGLDDQGEQEASEKPSAKRSCVENIEVAVEMSE